VLVKCCVCLLNPSSSFALLVACFLVLRVETLTLLLILLKALLIAAAFLQVAVLVVLSGIATSSPASTFTSFAPKAITSK